MAKASATDNKEVATRSANSISDADLRNLNPDNVVEFLKSQGVELTDISAFGSGFTILKEKDQLIGKWFIIVEWKFSLGDFGEFVSALIMTKDGDKFVINDGSAGIYQQLLAITEETEKRHGLVVRNGLTRSDYEYVDAQGKKVPARTYYLAQ